MKSKTSLIGEIAIQMGDIHRWHTCLDRRKETRRQKSKQSFHIKIMISMIHWHQRNSYEMKAEVLTFQLTYRFNQKKPSGV